MHTPAPAAVKYCENSSHGWLANCPAKAAPMALGNGGMQW